MVVQYNIPNEVIEKFKERGKNLAFLVGHKDGDLITVSHLIIPTQNEFRMDVDQGNKYQTLEIIFSMKMHPIYNSYS